MRIAIDCRLWNKGGVGRYTKNLVFNLLTLDNKNHYSLYFYKGDDFKGLDLDYPNLEKKHTVARWHSLAEQTIFNKELLKGNYDLVHFPYFSHPILYKRPFIITIHDLTILHYPTGKATTLGLPFYYFKRLGYLATLKQGVFASKKIICPSEFVKKDLLDNFKVQSEKIHVTYEGVDPDLAKQLNNFKVQSLKFKELPEKFFLYVGNCYPHKNVEFLTKIFDKALIPLILIGPDDFFSQRLRKNLNETQHTNNQVSSCHFLSEINDYELAFLYQKAQALVFPSLFEGFGLPIVEATYFDCPLILANIPIFHELAPKNALFFAPKNEGDLLNKIQMVQRGSWKKLTEAEKTNYLAKFSFVKMAKETLAIYHHL